MRNKLKILFLALILAIYVCVAAFAAPMEFSMFTVEVPEGWSAQEKGTTVVISALDDSAVVTVTLDTMGGASLEEIADMFAQELDGSEPLLEAGVYRFNFINEQGMDSVMLIAGNGNNFTAIGIAGDNPEVEIILDSLKIK